MTKNKKILLILAGIIIVILTGSILLNRQLPPNQEKGSPPFNILDGTIKGIDYQNIESFVAEINTAGIIGASEDPMEKIIKLNEQTEWTIYDQVKKEETPTWFAEAKKGDHILVFSVEKPESVNDIEEFTALKVLIFK